jgi:hypothetical protein
MIDVGEIGKLAELYDRYANALDPTTPESKQAKRQFYARLDALYLQAGQGTEFDAFRLELVHRCKEYLRKNL